MRGATRGAGKPDPVGAPDTPLARPIPPQDDLVRRYGPDSTPVRAYVPAEELPRAAARVAAAAALAGPNANAPAYEVPHPEVQTWAEADLAAASSPAAPGIDALASPGDELASSAAGTRQTHAATVGARPCNSRRDKAAPRLASPPPSIARQGRQRAALRLPCACLAAGQPSCPPERPTPLVICSACPCPLLPK